MPDFTYHVSDNLPPMDLVVQRDKVAVDLGNYSGSVYIRQGGASSGLAISGSVAHTTASTGNTRFVISGAASGSAGFTAAGDYLGQLFLSATSGRETIESEFTIRVKKSYRV